MDVLIDDPDPFLYQIMIRRKSELDDRIDLRKDNSSLLIPLDYVKPINSEKQIDASYNPGLFRINKQYKK